MKRWMFVAIVVVLVVGVALGVRFLASERGPVENDVPGPNGDVVDGVPDVTTATSMLFSVEVTNNETATYTYMAKDIGTEHLKLRVEWWGEGFARGVIIDAELRQVWYLENDDWLEMPQEEQGQVVGLFVREFEKHRGELYEWRGGDWTYTDPDFGYSFRIYDIEVDPALDDALFAP